MWKKKLLVQSVICIIISAVYMAGSLRGGSRINEIRAETVAAMSEHYTLSDIWDKSKKTASVIAKAPAAVTNYVIGLNESETYGKPLDEIEEGKLTSVYAVCGGMVSEIGYSEEYGNFIKIRHDDSLSVYGNCNKVYVKKGERVRKGQVIASFSNRDNTYFLFDIIK
jgi:biotin carboxyl carrier protein